MNHCSVLCRSQGPTPKPGGFRRWFPGCFRVSLGMVGMTTTAPVMWGFSDVTNSECHFWSSSSSSSSSSLFQTNHYISNQHISYSNTSSMMELLHHFFCYLLLPLLNKTTSVSVKHSPFVSHQRSSDFPVAGDSQSDLLRKFPLGKKTTKNPRWKDFGSWRRWSCKLRCLFFGEKKGRSEENWWANFGWNPAVLKML